MSFHHPAFVDASVDSCISMGDIHSNETSSTSSIVAHSSAAGDVDHTAQLSDRLASLCLSATDADVVLLVAGQRLPAHRLLLAAHSDHFRTLLRSDSTGESTQPEIELADCPSADAFSELLRYVYSGRITLTGLAIDLEVGVLALAHRFGFAALQLAIAQHLQSVLAVGNVCAIVDVARLFGLDDLHAVCVQFMDRNAESLLLETGFSWLSSDTLCALLRRDSFFAPEVKIFGAVREWSEANAATVGADIVAEVKSLVRLELIDMDQLLNVVRPTGFFTPDRILDVINETSTANNKPVSHRGNGESREISAPGKWPGLNMASRKFGAKVEGDAGMHDLLDNDGKTTAKGYLSHPITDDANAEGIVVELGTVCIINRVKLLLWDGDRRSYRYYVEVSVDRSHWERCIDHTEYDCRSWQKLFFSPRPVKYVKLVGTHNTKNSTFHVVSLEASYVDRPGLMANGFWAPRTNVARVERGAVVTVGSQVNNVPIDGDFTTYTCTTGYASHPIGGDAFVIQLGQPCWLESMRMLLWDRHTTFLSSFYVETSTDMQTWTMAVDRRNQMAQSWQSWTMESRLVIYVRIVGTFCQNNANFYLVHFECPSQVHTQINI